MAEGVDYSHARPGPQCLFDSGKRFVVRYVGPNTSSGKWLREPEKDVLRATGNVLAVYLHGLFENREVLKAFSGSEPEPLDTVFDGLADALDAHVDHRWLAHMLH